MPVPTTFPKAIADDGTEIEANKSPENSPSVLFDALVLPDGDDAVRALALDGHTTEYVKDQYRHCKSILALGASHMLLDVAGIVLSPREDPGLIFSASVDAVQAMPAFITAVAAHRHPSRDSDPPKI